MLRGVLLYNQGKGKHLKQGGQGNDKRRNDDGRDVRGNGSRVGRPLRMGAKRICG